MSRLRVGVPRASPPLAILYAIGVFWLVSSLAIGLLLTVSLFVRLPVSGLYLPATALAASAAAVAIALGSGRWAAALGLAVVAFAYALALTCGPSPTPEACASAVAPTLNRHVGEIIGAFAGVLLSTLVRPFDGRSALLLAAGLSALVVPPLRIVFTLDHATGQVAFERLLWIVRLQAAAFAVGGIVLGSMGKRPLWPVVTIGAALLLPWFSGTFRQWWQDMQDLGLIGVRFNLAVVVQTQWQTFLPPIYFGCVLLGLAIARLVLWARNDQMDRRRNAQVMSGG